MAPKEVEEVAVTALPAEQVAAVGKMYEVIPPVFSSKPPGKFLRGKHGITHFHLQMPKAGTQRSRIAVLSHGIGTDMSVFHGPICDNLVRSGFRVLCYDFLGHGWSYSNDTWMKYDEDIMCTQLSELLDHILAPGEPVDLWVGHSTGCLVGVLNALSTTHPIRALALISPAFWANKPFIAKVADKIPNFMHGLVSSVGPLKKLPQDGYLENNDSAFGKNGNKYLYPEAHSTARSNIMKKFELHPQLIGGILGIASFFLREDLISKFREPFKKLLQMEGNAAPRVCLLWGKYDIVVPFKHAQEDVMTWALPGRVSLVELEAGHESPAEVPDVIAREIINFAGLPSRM